MDPKLLYLLIGPEAKFLEDDSLAVRLAQVEQEAKTKAYREGKRGGHALAEHRLGIYERRLQAFADLPEIRDLVKAHTEGRELMLEEFDQAVRTLRAEAIRAVTPETIEVSRIYL